MVFEITQLVDGDVVLREADDEGEPLVRIRFSADDRCGCRFPGGGSRRSGPHRAGSRSALTPSQLLRITPTLSPSMAKG